MTTSYVIQDIRLEEEKVEAQDKAVKMAALSEELDTAMFCLNELREENQSVLEQLKAKTALAESTEQVGGEKRG